MLEKFPRTIQQIYINCVSSIITNIFNLKEIETIQYSFYTLQFEIWKTKISEA